MLAAGNYEPIAVTGRFRAETDRLQFFMVDGIKVVDVDFASIAERRVDTSGRARSRRRARENPLLSDPGNERCSGGVGD